MQLCVVFFLNSYHSFPRIILSLISWLLADFTFVKHFTAVLGQVWGPWAILTLTLLFRMTCVKMYSLPPTLRQAWLQRKWCPWCWRVTRKPIGLSWVAFQSWRRVDLLQQCWLCGCIMLQFLQGRLRGILGKSRDAWEGQEAWKNGTACSLESRW